MWTPEQKSQFQCTLYPLLPSGLKLENSSQRHWRLHISQSTCCRSKTTSSLPASSSPFSVFSTPTKDSILSKGCPKPYEPQHLSDTPSHEMQNFILLLTHTPLKCSGTSRTNIRSNQKNILQEKMSKNPLLFLVISNKTDYGPEFPN